MLFGLFGTTFYKGCLYMEYESICNRYVSTYLECMNKPPITTPITPITPITQPKKDKTKCKKEFDKCNECLKTYYNYNK